MSGDRYKITDQNAMHFLTFTVVDWVDVFTKKDYKLELVDSMNYCIKEIRTDRLRLGDYEQSHARYLAGRRRFIIYLQSYVILKSLQQKESLV